MRRLSVILLICLLLVSSIPFAYAAETVKLPALPELTFEEPYPAKFDTHHVVLKIGSDYYAIVFSQFKDIGGVNGLGIAYFTDGWRMTFRGYYVRYVETYKLSDLNSWDLVYKANEPTGDTAYQQIWFDSLCCTNADWTDGYNNDTLVAYSDLTTLSIYTFENASSTAKIYGADYEYSVEFEGGTSDDGSDDSGILSGIVDSLRSIGEWILDGISALFQPLLDYHKEVTELFNSVFTKLINLVSNMWETFKGFTLNPINDFLNQLNVSAINLWLSFFDLPIISDYLMIYVIAGLFAALIAFLKNR